MSLSTALTQVAALLRQAPREAAEFEGFTARLIEPLARVGTALKDEDLDYLLDINGWDVVNSTGQWARALLQFSRSPDLAKVQGLLVDFLGRGYRFDHLAAHIDRFRRDALTASQRLSAGVDGVLEWTTADGPSQWAKLFEISVTTFKKRLKDGSIRHKRLSAKSYLIAVADVPAKYQSKFRSDEKPVAK